MPQASQTSSKTSSPRQLSAVVFAPLGVEAFAIRRLARAPGVRIVRSGMGPARSKRTARATLVGNEDAVAVLGFCGALSTSLRPGDVVVADAVTSSRGSRSCSGAEWITAELRRSGIAVTRGVIRSTDHLVHGRERATLEAGGAVAVDMESAWLAPAPGIPFAVVRTVVDTPERELSRAFKTIGGAVRAYRSLGIATRVVRAWLEYQSSVVRSSEGI